MTNQSSGSGIYGSVTHEASGKVHTTYWDSEAIEKASVNNNFLIGPANHQYQFVWINENTGSEETSKTLSEGFSRQITYMNPIQFGLLAAQSKGGIIAIVILLLICAIAAVVYKCMCGAKDDNDYTKHDS